MLLSHAKVSYEDINYGEGLNIWIEAKATGKFEFGQLPAIEENGKVYSQSNAILRYLGIRYGYYPVKDSELAWRIDSILDSLEDIFQGYYKAAFAPPTEEEKAEGLKNYLATAVPSWLKVLEKRIDANSPHKYIVGDKITTADIALGAWAYSIYLNDANPN